MKEIACCGCICSDCKEFEHSCAGCNTIEGKPVWTKYTEAEVCPIYACCVGRKELGSCGKCDKIPCENFYAFIDPAMTQEEHERTVQSMVENAKNKNL